MGKVETIKFNLWFKTNHVLKDVDFDIKEKAVTAIMGPSGCGKSTLLRSINRMNDLINGCHTTGEIIFDGKNICDDGTNVYDLRRRIGMVFQKPNPFPKSIFENVAFGPKIHNMAKGEKLKELVEKSLRGAALLGRSQRPSTRKCFIAFRRTTTKTLHSTCFSLRTRTCSNGRTLQCIDPAATAHIERLVVELKSRYTVIIVTHNLQQAARVSDNTAFMYVGQMIEYGDTKNLFENPKSQLTHNYITGQFG